MDNKTEKFLILDTAGPEDYRQLRKRVVELNDAFLLCFDTTNRNSFEYMKDFYNEILEFRANDHIYLIIVGTKSDLQDERVISKDEAREYCDSIFQKYIETSAKDKVNINEVFYELIRETKKNPLKKDDFLYLQNGGSIIDLKKPKKSCLQM